jgi:hypothetical protein
MTDIGISPEAVERLADTLLDFNDFNPARTFIAQAAATLRALSKELEEERALSHTLNEDLAVYHERADRAEQQRDESDAVIWGLVYAHSSSKEAKWREDACARHAAAVTKKERT